MVDRKQQLLFQADGQLSACGINVYSTAEGFFLTNDSQATNLTKASREVKVINDMMLAEQDFNKEEMYSTFAKTYKKSTAKFCYLYTSFLKLFSELE